jgi:signal transduction histidine kinase
MGHTRSRILVLKDDPTIADVLASRLSAMGHEVVVARTPDEALAEARRFQPEIGLVEVVGTTCAEMIGALRAASKDMQCIAMSRQPELHRVIEAFHNGATDFLQDVDDVAKLEAAVDRCLRIRREATEAHEALRRAEAQASQAQKMEAIALLTGGIAHDFNNVLQGIIGFTNMASRRIKEGRIDSLEGYLQEIHAEATRSRDLIASLLLYSRGGKAEAEVVAAEPVIAQTLTLLRSALPKRIQLTADVDRRVTVRGNATQLQQLVMNLCINARDAIPASGGRIDVSLRQAQASGVCASCGAHVEGRFVEIAVSDDGAGIPADVVRRVFDPFFTTKDQSKGTGMGLAVTHGITHEHGGHILLSSYPGHTRFQLVFPVVEDVAEAPAPESVAPAERAHKLMVVDDEVIVGDYLGALFTDAGYAVTIFNDPRAALAAFTKDPTGWDLVITDQMMPSMTGERLARALLEQRPELPIILCSGYSERSTKAARVRAFLAKPYEAEVALETVRSLLGQPDPSTAAAGVR